MLDMGSAMNRLIERFDLRARLKIFLTMFELGSRLIFGAKLLVILHFKVEPNQFNWVQIKHQFNSSDRLIV